MQEFNSEQLLIDKEVPIPYKHIYLPNEKHKLEIWCFKQDIVIYEKLFDKIIGYRDAKISANGNELINVVLEKDNAQNSHHVGLPYVIIETKYKQPNTHEILTYSQKVQMIKTIFPYCRFVFLIFGSVSARTYRHGLYFDRIVNIINIDDEVEVNNFIQLVKELLNEVKEDIRKFK
ncbi:MAG: hypothetical protein HXY50_08245 [Ignavibacteriaceae bacterium]|nr:hypothetical protein [Ignavibacteriaceae bacterium]